MSIQSVKSSLQFVSLHSSLLYRFYLIDLLYLFLSIWFIIFDIHIDDPTRYITFLVLFCLFFTVLHIKEIVKNIAGVNFYRLLPTKGLFYIVISHGVVILPFTVVLLFLGVTIVLIRNSVAFLPHILLDDFLLRIGGILLVFCSLKLVSLPTMLLSKRHPAVLFAFYLTLMPLTILVLMFDEFFWQKLPLHELWGIGQFIISLTLLELFILGRK